MRRLSFSSTTLAALIYFAGPTPALPISTPSLTPRSQTCNNAPATVAGTPFTPRALLPPRHSTNTILWCAPHSQTYIILEVVTRIISPPLSSLLTGALYFLDSRLEGLGDADVPQGRFHWSDDSLMELTAWNTNNHQMTFGVLRAALEALEDYMTRTGMWGTVRFSIFDGANEVGAGEVF